MNKIIFETTDPEIQEMMEGLILMFIQAIEEKKWFYSPYQGVWFHPKELLTLWNEGKFLWGAINWKLRHPQERIDELKNKILGLAEQINDIKERIHDNRTTHP